MTGYVCMAVYRPDPDRLDAQLRSVAAQTVTDWVCLVGIDGHDDDAARLVRDVVGADPRFCVLEPEDRRGHYRNFERLLALVPADAGWVALSDQDDVWYPHKLETLVPHLRDVALVQGSARVREITGGRDAVVGTAHRRTDGGLFPLLVDNQVTGSFAVLRPEVLTRALPFPEPTDVGYHDHWLAVCAHLAGGLRTIDEPVQDYVQHGANVLGEARDGQVARRLAALRRAAVRRSPAAAADYLVEHRLGWRVRVARAALTRFGDGVAPTDRAALTTFARGRLARGLLASTVGALVRRDVPVARALALLVASTWVGVGGYGRTVRRGR
ncbi:glycosyltransferase [Cellulomonas cellasea]|uniref:Glycosyltransferase 2-like domain-containing protein n=1 Tax=Cellulomonas cellasea TaxID=43670 RepID=A0A7W4UHB0_9CELL|nr:glycosyltransferase [Cellulomonas cellasea]MBB2924162.1 hypothetical protein [Cellulomonas cellasea]